LKPTITLITVTFNSEKIIRDFLSQNEILNFDEIIVVDNCSTDNTIKIISNEFKDIKIIKNKRNIGYGSALNKGVTASKNEKVLLINPDTFFSKGFYLTLINAIKIKTNFSVLVPTMIEEGFSLPEVSLKTFFYRTNLYGSCFLVNIKKFKDTQIFDENIFLFFEDYDLIKRLELRKEKKIAINNCFLFFKRGGSSSSPKINKIKNWHYGWSFGYITKKYSYSLKSKIIIFNFFVKNLSRLFIYFLFFNFKRLTPTFFRLIGLIAFIFGVKAKRIGSDNL
jgi:N-acetylglucosaminyl-diphospho-decaprenol L-rhamnosyltransferase